MARNSREDKMLPPSFFSMMVAYLQRAYAHTSRKLMMTLRPFLIEAWRNGRAAEAAAQATRSCDGHIVPSPVFAVHIAKGSVRPPKGAQRGEVFGAESLRPPPRIERLQRQLARVSRDDQKRHTQASRWGARAQNERTDSARQGAAREQEAATAKRADLLAEAKRMETELQRLRQELNRPAMQRPQAPANETVAPSIPTKKEAPIAPPVAPSATDGSSAEQRKPQGRRGRGRPRSEAAQPSPTSGSNASVEAQNAALLSAVKGAFPDLAAQIAAQMVKEGGVK